MMKYTELQRRAKALDRDHLQELVVAFAGGCTSLVLAFAGVRLFTTARGAPTRSSAIGLLSGDAPEHAGLTLVDPSAADEGFAHSANEVELPLFGAGRS